MHNYEEMISELSAVCGIVPEYWDIFGKKHVTTLQARQGILRAMGLTIDSTDDIIREIRERGSRHWKNGMEPVHVISVNSQPLAIPLHLPIGEDRQSGLSVSWYLESEETAAPKKKKQAVLSGSDLTIHETQWIDGVRYIRTLLVDGETRDIGYYMLTAECRHTDRIFPGGSDTLNLRSRIIVTPDVCYMAPALEQRNVWGIAMNLYALKSKRNWGVGDFTDLKHLVRLVAGLHGSFIGINPLHAIPNTAPFGVSPYTPLSRLYKNFIYLDIDRVPEVAETEDLLTLISSAKFRSRIEELRRKEHIDYEAVAALKEQILRKAFDVFIKGHYLKKTKRGRAFQGYIAEEGPALESFALFMALRRYMIRTRDVFSWHDWPQEYQSPDGQAVRLFGKKHEREKLFYQYVQWLIDGQLKDLFSTAKRQQTQTGLYFDLAVGSAGAGSDAWTHKEVIAHGAEVGAPPDDFSPDGQKWGFPPLIPEKLRETGYELFIRTIQKNMKYSGAIRIDHALGLFRIFWVPDGMSARDGAYVQQPTEDLLRIIALESVRQETIVIAEDLGTIGENARETLQKYRMLSYRLFYFGRNYPDPSFLPPDSYPEMALCAVTTHDLPTLHGYWSGRDIETRRRLGTYPDDIWLKNLDDRERDKKLIISALMSQGLIPGDYPAGSNGAADMSPELCIAVYRYLARTPCKFLLVSLDDVIGTLDQQNLPGTVDEYPNWIQRMPLPLEEILKDRRLRDLAGALKNRAL
jgi:4-alpha-glucanotransferase